jgi:hypothetical protein
MEKTRVMHLGQILKRLRQICPHSPRNVFPRVVHGVRVYDCSLRKGKRKGKWALASYLLVDVRTLVRGQYSWNKRIKAKMLQRV